MLWLRRAAAALGAAEPEPEAAPLAAVAEPEEAPAAAPEQELAPTVPGPVAPEQWASEEDLRRARDAGAAARVRLLGARALPRGSTVTRAGA